MPAIHVSEVRLHPLFNHKDTTLRLPAQGLVLVTGANESGKSALIDAIAYALFGDTVSGRSPWPGDRGAVTVSTSALSVSRVRKSRTAVTWHRHGEAPVAWESPTKASDALAAEVGSLRAWAAGAVFNRRTGEAFLARSDADRKRLLEEILDLGALDAAHRRATAALAAASREASTVLSAAHAARARAVASKRAADAAGAPHPVQEPPSPALYLAHRQTAADAAAALEAARAADAETSAELRRIEARLRALVVPATVCHACRRPFDGAAEAAQHMQEERETLTAAREAAQAAHRATQTALAEAARKARAADDVLRGLDREAEAARQAARFLAVREELAATARADAEAAEHAEALCVAPAHRVAVLTAARDVLGVTGVRGHLLASALPVLESHANSWLSRLGRPQWRFALATSSQNADGVTTDRLSVALTGTPNDAGYAGLSEGAKHRVHLAMAMALGELTGGAEGGTWFFDEALDAPLDSAGAADTAEVLRDLARGTTGPGRCVVVIGHSPEIARVLRPDYHYEVVDGVVSLRRTSAARVE